MSEWKSGQVILGEYAIEKELGRGGMGRVWLVKSNSIGRRFAVKQTLLKEDKHRKAFLAELQTWIDLPEHPNIVPCRFFRTVGDDVLIFSEFVDGGSLKNWIDSRRLYEGDQRQSLKRILDTAIQFAWGLHSIHELGLVHQDVKPGNVLMSGGAEAALQGMRVQVSDYGLARARARSGAQGVQSAGEGSILLSSGGYTPAYCSPEQAKGLPITRKTDQWSWGVSVLEMFTDGVTWHSGHLAGAVLDQYVEDADESSGIPVMPLALAEILRKCFQNDPAKRWANLGEVVANLKTTYSKITGEKYDRELVAVVHRGTPQAGLAERRSAHGGEWADPRMCLEKALRLSGRNPAEASEITERQGRSRRGQLVSDLAIFEEAKSIFLDMVKKGRRDLEPDIARLCMNKALVHCTADDIPGAIAEYDQAIAVRRRLLERDKRWETATDLAVSLMNKGHTLANYGDLQGAVNSHGESVAIWERLVEQERRWESAPDLAAALMNKGATIYRIGDSVSAAQLYDKSITIWRQLVQREGRREFAVYLARTLLNKGLVISTPAAVKFYEEGISILQELVERDGQQDLAPDLALALMTKGNGLQSMGESATALALYDRSYAILRRSIDHDGRRELASDLAAVLMNKGSVLLKLRELPKAIVVFDECVTIRRRLVEQEGRHDLAFDLATTMIDEGAALCGIGNLARATELYDDAITILRSLGDQKGRERSAPYLATALRDKGITLLRAGNMSGAAKSYDECIAIWRQLVDHNGRIERATDLASALISRGSILHSMGDLQGALALYDECIAIRRRLAEPHGLAPVETAEAELVRIGCLLDLQQGRLLQSDCARAQEAYSVILRESQRTGRADLAEAVEWAQNNLTSILPRG